MGPCGEPTVDHFGLGEMLDLDEWSAGVEGRFAARFGHETERVVGEVVPGCTLDGPVAGKLLLADRDLLDQQDPVRPQDPAEPLQRGGRIGQPVDVVETKTVDEALGDQLGKFGGHGVEDAVVLHSNRSQPADLEEHPIVPKSTGIAAGLQAVVALFSVPARDYEAADVDHGLSVEHRADHRSAAVQILERLR